MKFLLINVIGGTRIALSGITSRGLISTPPLGLLYIGRALEDEGHEIELLDIFFEINFEEKIKKSLTSADAIGISLTSYAYEEGAEVAKTIKAIDASIPVIIGGSHCIFHPKKSLIDIPDAEISVAGEGEQSIKDIVKALNGEKKLSEVPGIFYRKIDKIESGKPLRIIKDLDSIPFPARHLVEKYDYGKYNNSYFFKPKLTSIVTSRGCPFQCRFCTRNVSTFNTFRQRSAENVVKEIQEIDDKYKSLFIVDENFLTDKKRIHKILSSLIEIGIDLDLLIMGARADTADQELYKKMKKAGVKFIQFGLESGNQDVLDFYNKNITLNQIRKAVNLSSEMNFLTLAYFILGAPIETERHIEKTIKFACSLPLDVAIFSPLSYMYGSDLWNEAVQNGIINENDGYSIIADSRRGIGNFTEKQLTNFCQKAFKRFYLRPSYISHQIIKAVMKNDYSLLKTGLNILKLRII